MQVNQAIATTGSAESADAGLQLDSRAFMSLLVAQLRHQDPLNPMSNEQLVVQLAQLSEVESIRAMQASMATVESAVGTLAGSGRLGAAAALIGMDVTYASGAGVRHGSVSEVSVESEGVFAWVDGERVALDDIVRMRSTAATDGE